VKKYPYIIVSRDKRENGAIMMLDDSGPYVRFRVRGDLDVSYDSTGAPVDVSYDIVTYHKKLFNGSRFLVHEDLSYGEFINILVRGLEMRILEKLADEVMK
jgi:hypothetical protein